MEHFDWKNFRCTWLQFSESLSIYIFLHYDWLMFIIVFPYIHVYTCVTYKAPSGRRHLIFMCTHVLPIRLRLGDVTYDRIEINNLLEVFVQISKTSFGFCNNLGLRPRLLPNPTSVFDICTNTSNSLFISILYVLCW